MTRTTPTTPGAEPDATQSERTIASAAADAAPTALTDGLTCLHTEWVSVFAEGGASLTAATVQIYVLPPGGEAADWTESVGDSFTLSDTNLSEVVNLRVGGVDRVFARCTAPTDDAVTLKMTAW